MHVEYHKAAGVFVLRCPFEQRDVPKSRGLRWHAVTRCEPSCPLCAAGLGRHWYTPHADHAESLRDVAELSEATREAIAEAQQRARESRAHDAEVDVLHPEGLDYFPFQRAGIAYALGRMRVLISDVPGLGKTVQAIGVRNALRPAANVTVVCPASLRINWRIEWQRWSVHPDVIHMIESKAAIPPEANVVIVNYDRLTGATLDDLRTRFPVDLMIVDEAHMIKSPEARRTKAIAGDGVSTGLAAVSERLLLLTGTPMLNRPIDLWSLLRLLDPVAWGNRFSYAMRYCAAKKVVVNKRTGQMAWDMNGSSNLAELQQRLRQSCMVRRTKAEVMAELPAKRRQLIVLPDDGELGVATRLERSLWAEHETKLAQQVAELQTFERSSEAYVSGVRKLRFDLQLALESMSTVRQQVALAKVPAVVELARSFLDSSEAPLVIWGHHHAVLEALAQAFAADGALLCDGRTPLVVRQGAVEDLQAGRRRVLVCGIHAMGTGHTMTAASHAIFAEIDWVPAIMAQAEDRHHRIGTTEPVLIQHVVADGTIEAAMARSVLYKQRMADAALDKPNTWMALATEAVFSDAAQEG